VGAKGTFGGPDPPTARGRGNCIRFSLSQITLAFCQYCYRLFSLLQICDFIGE